jgi:hypothetical protein
MGSPRYPTPEQVEQLNARTKLPPPSRERLSGNHLDVEIEPNALVLIEVPRAP